VNIETTPCFGIGCAFSITARRVRSSTKELGRRPYRKAYRSRSVAGILMAVTSAPKPLTAAIPPLTPGSMPM
jgi:hypothetical protein